MYKKLVLFLIIIFLNTQIFILTIKLAEWIVRNQGKVKGDMITLIRKENILVDRFSTLKYFFEPKPGSEVWQPEWLGYHINNSINQDTLNEEKDYFADKNKDTYRIITLGDSYTYGLYVNTSENFSERLENFLNSKLTCAAIRNFEVINLGVYSYDLNYSVERFLKRGLKYNPDLVLWLINNWNFEQIKEYSFPYEIELKTKGITDYDPNIGIHIQTLANNKLKLLMEKKAILEFQKSNLNRLLNIYNGTLVFLSFPSLRQEYQNIIDRFITAKIKYYYAITDISKDKNYLLLDGHPNVLGHWQIASDIYEYIKTTFLKSCQEI